jgi:hypothetical protein
MKTPLNRQITEYDCGPTGVLNALSFLFEREEIPPEIPKYVMMYCLDAYNAGGECGKNGTSKMAMQFLASWLNQYAEAKGFPVECVYLHAESVSVDRSGEIIHAIEDGGAVLVRLMHECRHYVLFTGVTENAVELFDPYYEEPESGGGIESLNDPKGQKNRRVSFERLEGGDNLTYSLGDRDGREAVLFFNKNTRKTRKTEIEYFI